MSLEEQQKIEEALKKNREEKALSLEDQELLMTVKGLGISNKQGLLNFVQNAQNAEQPEQTKYQPDVSQSPYNSQVQQKPVNEYVDPRIIEILKGMQKEIEFLKKQISVGDVKSKVLSFLKDNADKYILSASLPQVQEAITQHYSDILLRGEDWKLEDVVAYYEEQEIKKYNAIKEKENEKGGELYPKALGQLEDIKNKAEAISKSQETNKPEPGKELDTALTDKDKQELDQSQKEHSNKLKAERELNGAEPPPQTKPKLDLSQNVSAVTVDELVQKHGFVEKKEGETKPSETKS